MCAYKLKENSGKCFDYSYPMFRVAQESFGIVRGTGENCQHF